MRLCGWFASPCATFAPTRAPKCEFGAGLTVITGPNGAGKTNLIEALYFGCTGRSCRTTNEREVVRFGAAGDARGRRRCGRGRRATSWRSASRPGSRSGCAPTGRPWSAWSTLQQRPLVSVFLPDRLELIKGAPSLRRAHLDQFVAALWPARAATRRAYAQTLAQRNALIARIRNGAGSRESLRSWDLQLAQHGIALMADRATRRGGDRPSRSPDAAAELGLDGEPALELPAAVARAGTPKSFAAELAERIDSDLERGFTGHGPHRDDLVAQREGRELRAYGSQGQQRLALLALLLAEREALASRRDAPPLMLLDDVMSELDHDRRRGSGRPAAARPAARRSITATDLDRFPGPTSPA